MIDLSIPWANYVTFQCLNFFICVMKMILAIYLLIYLTKLLWGYSVDVYMLEFKKTKQVVSCAIFPSGTWRCWVEKWSAQRGVQFPIITEKLINPQSKTVFGIISQKSYGNKYCCIFHLRVYLEIFSLSIMLFLIRFCHETQML